MLKNNIDFQIDTIIEEQSKMTFSIKLKQHDLYILMAKILLNIFRFFVVVAITKRLIAFNVFDHKLKHKWFYFFFIP